MSKKMIRYDLLISCPGDANYAVNIVEKVVEEFNQLYSDTLGILIRTRHWSKSAYSESGGKPQALLNKQIVNDVDLAVAIFKNRFGTPTEDYGSGTEEEIEILLADGKQVFVFFDESPCKIAEVDKNEYERVQIFKERYKKKGIFWTYSSEEELKNTFRAHLTQYFMTLNKENASEGESNIKIKSYKNGIIEENVQLSLFDMGGFISSDKFIVQIKDAIKNINGMELVRSSLPTQSSRLLFARKKVELEKSTTDLIKFVAEKLEIKLLDTFFDIGNLTESSMFSNISFVGSSLDGTKEEKAKYKAIISLEKLIYKTQNHITIEQCYSNLYGIEFVLCNDGTKFDEDIDVNILIPTDRYIGIDELSVPSDEVYLGDDWSFDDIFEISATKDFISFSETKKSAVGLNSSRFTPVSPFASRDYEEEYRETLRNIYEYQVYPDGEYTIVKLHFDYIKQHQCAAFPTWIFINKPEEGLKIKYSLTTKNNKSVIEGYMDIKANTD